MILSNIKDIQNNFQQNENLSYLKLMMFQLSAYSENKYTVYRSVVLKNNTLGTVDVVLINKLLFLIFLIYKTQSMLFLIKYESDLIVYMVSAPSHYNEG